MLQWYKADLHVHTVLSPCAELTMGPVDIVKTALEHELDILAITDHNSAENTQAVVKAAENEKLFVIPGMEVYTREDAHSICLFPDLDAVGHFQSYIYEHLMPGEYDASMFGPQYVCDFQENIIDESKRMFALPVSLNIYQVASTVVDLNGIIYPAHIDRKSYSLLRSLGFIPDNLPFDALEIAQPFENVSKNHRFLLNTTKSIITASDAHDISMLGSKYTWFYIEKPDFKEIRKALKKQDGRKTSLELPEEMS